MLYAQESFTPEEETILSRFFTNSDLPVFAIVNLPEIVKGALFARYSRTHKSLRRIFLEEYYRQPEIGLEHLARQISTQEPDQSAVNATLKAEQLYERVFFQYGDDSVAQLGGAHLACEQASAILTKIIERGRIAAYLEQSTRYIYYDRKISDSRYGQRYRYTIPSELRDTPLAQTYRAAMDELFQTYSDIVATLNTHFERKFPQGAEESKPAYRRAIRAKACDVARGLLPAATISNLGIFATGQAYEAMLIRMNAHPLAEAREYSQMMLQQLRKVIPGFLKRVDIEDRGVAWSRYYSQIDADMRRYADELIPSESATPSQFQYDTDEVKLVYWTPEAEQRLVASALYPYSQLSEQHLLELARNMDKEQIEKIISAYIGKRSNRRHKPGRAMERIHYRFDVLSDFGSFRDLQRHRMMTIEWQPLTTQHGYSTPPEIEEVGDKTAQAWHQAMDKMDRLYHQVRQAHGIDTAQYIVPFAFRIRYAIQLNARQAFHMLELRTAEQGHPDYRRICLKMHQLIKQQAQHNIIADAMTYIDRKDYGLGRLNAEQRQDEKRRGSLDETS